MIYRQAPPKIVTGHDAMTADAVAAVDLSFLQERLASNLAESLTKELGNRSVFETRATVASSSEPRSRARSGL